MPTPCLLGPLVVRVIIAGRQGVRTHQDPPLDLGAQPVVPRLAVHGANVPAIHPGPVTNPVVPGQVGGGLR